MFDGWESARPVFFYYWWYIIKMRNKKLKKNDFGGFQLQEVREKNRKNWLIHMWFLLYSQTYKKIIKYFYFISSYINQIWLHDTRNDCHFFYIFEGMIATLATKRNSFKKTPPKARACEILRMQCWPGHLWNPKPFCLVPIVVGNHFLFLSLTPSLFATKLYKT